MPNRTNVNNGIATLTVHETLQPGTYTITGHYNGSNNFMESEGEAELEVLKKTTTTTLSSPKQTYSPTEDIILNIQVKDGNNNTITTGTYQLYEGNNQISTGVINGNSVAVNIGKQTPSVKTYKVIYQENQTYTGSTSNNLEVTINKINTITSLQSTNLYVNGQSVIYAHVENEDGTLLPPDTGKMIAKINGQSVKDDNGKVIYITPDEYGDVEFVFTKTGLNTTKTYTVLVKYAGTTTYDSSEDQLTQIQPELNHPEITEIDNLAADSINGGVYEDNLLLFDVEITLNTLEVLIWWGNFLDTYLEEHPLLIVAAGSNDMIGYLIGVRSDDSDTIEEVLNSGVANTYYLIKNNDENADGTFDGILTSSSGEGVISMNINLGVGALMVEDVEFYDLYVFGTELYTWYDVATEEE